MSDNPKLVRAKHKNGTEQDVPVQWLDEKTTPFPGQWTRVEEEKVKAAPSVEPTKAGDSEPASGTATAKAAAKAKATKKATAKSAAAPNNTQGA